MQSVGLSNPDIGPELRNYLAPRQDMCIPIDSTTLTPLIERRSASIDVGVSTRAGKYALNMCGVYANDLEPRMELGKAELLLAEWVHMGYVFPGDQETMTYSMDVLNDSMHALYGDDAKLLSIQRMDEIVGAVERDIAAEVDRVDAAVQMIRHDDELRKQVSAYLGTEVTRDMPPVIIAAILTADASHGDDERHNGGRVFDTHIVGTTQLIQYAWNEVNEIFAAHGEPVPDAKYLTLQIVTMLLHDAWEDRIKKNGTSPLRGDNLTASPRFVYRMMRHYGYSVEDADAMCDDLIHLTKTRDVHGKTFDEKEYDERRAHTIRTTIAKSADNTDNTRDPKRDHDLMSDAERAKNAATQEGYNHSFDHLADTMSAKFNDAFGMAMIERIRLVREDDTAYETFKAARGAIVIGVPSRMNIVFNSGHDPVDDHDQVAA